MAQLPGLIWRALLAFVALPATVAFVVPWLLRPTQAQVGVAGILAIVTGTVLLLWCVRDFYVTGRGTLAPWSPPEHLVTTGLYRFSRNPMYLAVLLILFGWAVAFPAIILWVYLAGVALAFQLRIVFHEERWLARTHGRTWADYRARVPRWIGWYPRARTGGHQDAG